MEFRKIIFTKKTLLLLVAQSLVQTTLILYLTVFEPVTVGWQMYTLVISQTVLPIATVLAILWRDKAINKLLVFNIIFGWLASSTLYSTGDMAWFMLFPLLMLLNSAIGAHKTGLIATLMGLPLLLSILTSSNYFEENIIILLALVISLIVFITDHKEHQNKQMPQHVSDQQFVALINSMADGVLAIGSDHTIKLYNGAALNILNVNTSLEGKKLENYLTLIDKRGRAFDLTNKIKKMHGYFVSRDLALVFPDNDKINLYVGITPVVAGYGQKNSGYVILLRDITKEKTLEEERDEFISVVSHELRTPAAITEGNISNAQMLLSKKGVRKNVVNDALEEAHKQAVFLSSLINDLATLSRAERGVLKVEPELIKVDELLKDLAKDYKPEVEIKGLYIKVQTDKKLIPLKTSRLYLHEILQNFITNSIKYTKKGGVTVSAEPTHGGVMFKIKDTGIGISKSDQQHIFDKFFRSEDFRTRENSGTGLGLYVTMKLIKLLKAEVKVDSAIDEGSEFSITVPNYEIGAGAHAS